MKTGNSTAAHSEGARHTACSPPPRAHFKAFQPRTARGFQSSGILEAAPQLLARLVNKQKWQKDFQNVIYTHVCRSHVFTADTERSRPTEPAGTNARKRQSNRLRLWPPSMLSHAFSRLMVPHPSASAPGCGAGSVLRSGQERVLRPARGVRHGRNHLPGIDPAGVSGQVLVQQRKALVCLRRRARAGRR